MKQNQSSNEHLLVLDNGDFIGGRGKKEQVSGEYLAKAFAQMKYNAINLGERDFLPGLKFLTELQEKYKLPFISANVFQPNGEDLVFRPYIIKELKGFQQGDTFIPSVKIGIFGVMLVRSQLTYDGAEPKLVVSDPIEAAKKVVSEIKDKCDLIIGLVHIPYPQLTPFVQSVPGIDLIIAGHDPVMRIEPQKIDNTLIMVGGNRGQYIGDLRLVLNQQKEIIDYEGKVATLDEAIKDDPEMSKLIKEHKEQEAKVTYEIDQKQYQSIEMYVGASKCKECHEDQFEQWEKTSHARAFDRLVKNGKAEDLNCARCHTTGFGQYNGFYNYKETPQMAGVQCEVCHGIGKLHVQSIEKNKSQKLRAAILAPISEETCIACHDKTQDPKFNYEKDVKKVKH